MPAGAKVARLGDSDRVLVGDQVVVVGAPYGLSYSLSIGWISARWQPNTVYRAIPLAEFFQTNATINTGNSGGPMFTTSGEVIGIVSHIISKSGGSEGLGFVVTLRTARELLLEKKSVWGGIDGMMLTGDLASSPVGDWQEELKQRGVSEEAVRLLASCVALKLERRPAAYHHFASVRRSRQGRREGRRPEASRCPSARGRCSTRRKPWTCR